MIWTNKFHYCLSCGKNASLSGPSQLTKSLKTVKVKNLPVSETVQCTVGWSDTELWAIFENGHYAAHQVYFYESNIKNRRIWVRAQNMRGKAFTFKNS